MTTSVLFLNEIATFNRWYIEHKTDEELKDFIKWLVLENLAVSDRIYLCKDWLKRKYGRPELGLGMAYWVEGEK